jgi:hypothetical protein
MTTKKEIPVRGLGVEAVKKTLLMAWGTYERKFKDYSPVLSWKGPNQAELSFMVGATMVKGEIQVEAEKLIVCLDVPFLLRSFVPKAENAIAEEVNFWLKKASTTT